MKSKAMISIIVPIYKVEKFLSKCIESILSQTYTNFELLLIDDGSPDNSGKICEEYALKDSRVKVFHKENGGVSSARNLGLREAKGEWVTFVDADDIIKKDFLKGFNIGNIDFFISSYECSSGNDIYNVAIDIIISKEGNHKEELEMLTKGLFLKTVWAKLFKSQIIRENNIWFNESMKVGEDTAFSINYFAYCKVLRFDSNTNYVYTNDSCDNGFVNKYKLSFNNFESHYNYLNEKIESLEYNWNRKFNSLRDFSKQLYYGLFLKYLLLNPSISIFMKERNKFLKGEGKIYNLRILFISNLGWKLFIYNKITAIILFYCYKMANFIKQS